MSHVNVLEEPEITGIRDAIHIAVVSLRSSADMNPGQPVTWHEKGKSVKPCSFPDIEIGIVNPFIRGGIGHFLGTHLFFPIGVYFISYEILSLVRSLWA